MSKPSEVKCKFCNKTFLVGGRKNKRRGTLHCSASCMRESRKIIPSRETLYSLYITQGKTLEEIGAILGVCKSTVGKWLKKEGIKARKTHLYHIGRKLPEKHKKKIGLANKTAMLGNSNSKGRVSPMKGRRQTTEARRKIGNSQRGEKHYNWKGGVTPEHMRIRNSDEYKEWRMKVLQRDRFSCVNCGYRSRVKRDIVVDHIKPFCLYPELRLEVSNGRTLCRECDNELGWNYFREMNPSKKELTT